MFKISNISFEKTKALNSLVLDYIQKKEDLKPFYEFFPDKTGFSEIIKQNSYENFDRKTLCDILLKQAKIVNNTTEKTVSNINLLLKSGAYTVTTGHQLCLFTGPLYFIYKVFSVINLAEELKRLFPGNNFLPVYWMASEDHDFDEINHFNVYGKQIKWDSSQTGMAGDFKTGELKEILSQFKEIMGDSANSGYLVELFEKAYLGHSNMKEATRFLVNELFGKYGLIIADGNDPGFKIQAKNILRKDIFENTAHSKVTETIGQLQNLKYHIQVKPREINCFYIEEGLRARIEKEEDHYKAFGTGKKFSGQQLENIIENETEKISPNVVLRPLYQQFILPNIAYVGGPGEIAYWLEYKKMFSEFNIQFPVLMPRNFITVIDKHTLNKIEKLGFTPEDFFNDEKELIRNFQAKENKILNLENEQQQLSVIYDSIKEKIEAIDKTLVSALQAEEQKALKGLEITAQKANRALKQRSETEINQIKAIKQKLFPNGIPQERYENFSSIYLNHGETFFTFLKENIHPFNFSHNILSEVLMSN